MSTRDEQFREQLAYREFLREEEKKRQEQALMAAVADNLTAYDDNGWRGGGELGEDVIAANVNEWQQKSADAAARAEQSAQSALAAENRGDMEVASMFWQDSMNYDRQAQNYSAEAARYEAMSPGTAPKPVSMNPAQTPKYATPPSAPSGAATQGELAAGQEKAVWAVPDKGRQESAPAGSYADREALERQIAGLQREMQAYSDASGGKGDPQVLIRYANRIHDAMRALDALTAVPVGEDILSDEQMAENYGREAVGNDGMRRAPNTAPKAARSGEERNGKEETAESDETKAWQEYLKKSARQIVMGNYTDDVTLAGTAGQIALGLLGADLPADIRDLTYDLTHLRTTPWYQTLGDLVALLPVVGGLKYADEATTLLKQGLHAAEAGGDMAKQVDELVDAGKAAVHLVEGGTGAAEGAKLADRLMEVGQGAGRKVDFTGLDQKTVDEYTRIIQQYDDAANAQETITYFRVQGGVKDTATGLNRSQQRIFITDDGGISIPKKNTQLSFSAYTTQHAAYYKGTRGEGAEVIAFDVPRYLDDLMRENAVLADNYRHLPWNQGGTAPKIPDINQPGFPYNVGQPWLDWLEEYAYNARYIDLGGKK